MRFNLSKNWIKLAGMICALLLLFGGGYFLLLKWEGERQLPPAVSLPPEEQRPVVYHNGSPYVPREDLTTLLFLGVDKHGEMVSSGSYLNDGQCDVVTLLVLDETNNAYTLLHLDRDTMTPVRHLGVDGQVIGTSVMQLALAHTYGDGMEESCENTVAAVEELLYGTEIDHYFAINMSGLSKLVDAAGGVTVTILGDFSQVDSSLLEGETMTLTGEQCLTYLRGRYQVGEQTNQERRERQAQFLRELLPKLELDTSLEALSGLTSYMLTDLSVNRLERLSERIKNARFDQLVSPAGQAVMGREYMEFHVEETALRELVIQTFYQPAEE